VLPGTGQIVDRGEDLDPQAIHERNVNGVWRPLQEGLDDSRVDRHGALHVESSAGKRKGRVAELWRTSHVLASRLAEKNTLNLARPVTDPKVGALLLVEVVDHDLMLDVVKEHGAAIGPSRSTRNGLWPGVEPWCWRLQLHIVRARPIRWRLLRHGRWLILPVGSGWAFGARLFSLEVVADAHRVQDRKSTRWQTEAIDGAVGQPSC
jgi:hypothetical protein